MLNSINRCSSQENLNIQSCVNQKKNEPSKVTLASFKLENPEDIKKLAKRRFSLLSVLTSKNFKATVSPLSLLPFFVSGVAIGVLAYLYSPSRMEELKQQEEISNCIKKLPEQAAICRDTFKLVSFPDVTNYYDKVQSGLFIIGGCLSLGLLLKISHIYQNAILDQLTKFQDSEIKEKIDFCEKHSSVISDEYIYQLGLNAFQNNDLQLAKKAAKIIKTAKIRHDLYDKMIDR